MLTDVHTLTVIWTVCGASDLPQATTWPQRNYNWAVSPARRSDSFVLEYHSRQHSTGHDCQAARFAVLASHTALCSRTLSRKLPGIAHGVPAAIKRSSGTPASVRRASSQRRRAGGGWCSHLSASRSDTCGRA